MLTNINAVKWMIVAATCAASAPLALAQAAGKSDDGAPAPSVRQLIRERSSRVGPRAAQPEADGQAFVRTSAVYVNNGVKLVLEDGKVAEVSIDGKAIDVSRAVADGKDYVIRDENGGELTRFAGAAEAAASTKIIGAGEAVDRLTRRGPADRDAQRNAARDAAAEPAPKVMLGISMATPSADLAGHFGLKASAATQVTGVAKDSPAGEAGLKIYDLITAVAGQPATPESIRQALRNAKVGDEIELTVLQRGVEKKLKVKLAAHDAKKLADMEQAPSQATMPGALAGLAGIPGIEGLDQRGVRILQDVDRQNADSMMELAKRLRSQFGVDGNQAVKPFIVPVEPLHMPGAQDGEPAAQDDRLQRIEDRLEKLEKLLREIAKKK